MTPTADAREKITVDEVEVRQGPDHCCANRFWQRDKSEYMIDIRSGVRSDWYILVASEGDCYQFNNSFPKVDKW
jgi:hypothetical protein